VVFLASYCTQSHLVYAPGSVAVVAVSAVLGLWAARAAGRRPGWTWLAVGSGVGLLSWSAPFWQQLTGNPGNLWQLYKTALGAHQARLGGRLALEQVGSGIRPIPPWLQAPVRLSANQVGALHGDRPWAVGAVVALVALVAIAAWRRDHAVVAAASIALIADGCAFWVLSEVPAARYLSLLYLRWILWPSGMMTWLALGWGSLRLVNTAFMASGRSLLNDAQRSRVLTVGVAAVVVAPVVLCLRVGSSTGRWDKAASVNWQDQAPIARRLVKLLDVHHVRKGRLRLDVPGMNSAFLHTAMYQLRVHGWHPTTLSVHAHLGSFYDAVPADSVVTVRPANSHWPVEGSPIGVITFRPPDASTAQYHVYLWQG
jgi:hypothetical protein